MPGYPQSLSIWSNVRRPVNDVFQYDGVTYFFSGTNYQEFDDSSFRVSFSSTVICYLIHDLLFLPISTMESRVS